MSDIPIEQIAEEAATWCLRLADDDMSEAEREDFALWLERSPTHRAEFEAISGIWDNAADLSDVFRAEIDSIRPADQAEKPETNTKGPAPMRRSLQWGMGAIAASLVAGTIAAWLLFSQGTPNPGLPQAPIQQVAESHYSTLKGESRRLRLEDGSYVHLNTDTRVSVAYDAGERLIKLEAGEALFEVRHQPTRPFIVMAGETRVRAIGTKFVVSTVRPDLSVTVTEGKVRVSWPQENGRPVTAVDLVKGERAIINPSVTQPVALQADINADKLLSWREGKLAFDGEPLKAVVADFNRYNDMLLTLADPSIEGLEISGYFDANDPQGFAGVMEKVANLRATIVSDKEIRLSPAG
jgi:transmembrane sensor